MAECAKRTKFHLSHSRKWRGSTCILLNNNIIFLSIVRYACMWLILVNFFVNVKRSVTLQICIDKSILNKEWEHKKCEMSEFRNSNSKIRSQIHNQMEWNKIERSMWSTMTQMELLNLVRYFYLFKGVYALNLFSILKLNHWIRYNIS